MTRSSRVTAPPPVLMTCLVRGNLTRPTGGASIPVAPSSRSSASTSSAERSKCTRSKPSLVVGAERANSFAMATTAGLPRPKGIVGWSWRAATRRTHSSVGTEKAKQAARRGLKAMSRTLRLSSAFTLHLSATTQPAGPAVFAAVANAASKAAREPPSWSWLTTTTRLGWALASAAANVLLPTPGQPHSTMSSGKLAAKEAADDPAPGTAPREAPGAAAVPAGARAGSLWACAEAGGGRGGVDAGACADSDKARSASADEHSNWAEVGPRTAGAGAEAWAQACVPDSDATAPLANVATVRRSRMRWRRARSVSSAWPAWQHECSPSESTRAASRRSPRLARARERQM
mmetsp:Transcript_13444/g.35880  ORF Transcript_13444/g.35880 Transcript_13444/m.35880 type:complete len:347 (+) Transcript_13444:1195-2235(+)